MPFFQFLMRPIRAIKKPYLPLLTIFFAYGCSTFSAIGESFFVKEKLNLSAEALLALGAWLMIPWTLKMVFGQCVDSLPLLGSPRRGYIFLASFLMIMGSLILAGLAGNWPFLIHLASANHLYVAASVISVLGVVLQNVTAEAMSVEVVSREGKTQQEIDTELAMVQLLGRLALSFGVLLVSGLGGWLADILSYEHLFLLTLLIPLIAVVGAVFIKIENPPRQPINPTVLIGGLIFAVFAGVMGLMQIPCGQEIVFMTSLILVLFLLFKVNQETSAHSLKSIMGAAIVIFVFRAMPGPGPGTQWFMIDILHFDKSFFGTLSQIGAVLSIVGLWFFSRWMTERSVGTILAVLTVIYFILSLPILGLYYGLHEWTGQFLGFGAKTIVLIDTTLSSPFADISMVPMLALIAKYAPRGNAATWFALMASLMNLALTAGSLFSKYLNRVFVVTREVRNAAGQVVVSADYSQLGHLLVITTAASLILPLLAIWIFLKR